MTLRKEPEERDQPAEQFSEDISRHLDAPVVLARDTIIYRVGRFVRRNRVASAAAGLLLIGVLGGVFAISWQALRAKVANAPTEHRSNDVDQLAHSGLINYHLPVATRRDERLMKDGLTSDVRHDLAEVHNGVGSAMEGHGDMALENYKAPQTYEELAADTPTNRTYGRNVSVVYANPGGVLFLTGGNVDALNLNDGDYLARTKRPQAALEAFRMKLALAEESVAADLGNPQVQAEIAYSSYRIGDLLVELGDHADALFYYQRAVDIYTRTVATGQEDLATALQLSRLLGKLAKTHARLGYIEKARAECSKAADLLQTIPDDGANVEQRRVRALAYAEIAEAYSLLARDARTPQRLLRDYWRAARDMYQRSLEILTDLRDRGVLDSEEVAEIDTLSHKVAECDTFLAK